MLSMVLDGASVRYIRDELGVTLWQVHLVKKRAGLVGRINDMLWSQRRAIIQDYVVERGQTYAQASRQTGVPAETLRGWARRSGLQGSYYRRVERRRQEVYERWRGGEEQKAIAQDLGVHRDTIANDVRIMNKRGEG